MELRFVVFPRRKSTVAFKMNPLEALKEEMFGRKYLFNY